MAVRQDYPYRDSVLWYGILKIVFARSAQILIKVGAKILLYLFLNSLLGRKQSTLLQLYSGYLLHLD